MIYLFNSLIKKKRLVDNQEYDVTLRARLVVRLVVTS